jgi:hypothetical protein
MVLIVEPDAVIFNDEHDVVIAAFRSTSTRLACACLQVLLSASCAMR